MARASGVCPETQDGIYNPLRPVLFRVYPTFKTLLLLLPSILALHAPARHLRTAEQLRERVIKKGSTDDGEEVAVTGPH